MTTYVRRGLHVENPDRNDCYHRLFLKYFIEENIVIILLKINFPKYINVKISTSGELVKLSNSTKIWSSHHPIIIISTKTFFITLNL